jgi:alpha-amylase
MLSEMGALALPSWAEVARFRSRHPAVGAGNHQLISAGPYTFQRTYRGGNVVDNVVVVMGAEGRTRVNVSGAFPDDAIVRDAITGSTGFVSFGYVSLTPDESGVLLLELAAQP